MVLAGATVAVCLGSFCGFSQGSKWGRTLRQQNEAIALFPKLRNKYTWRIAFNEDPLMLIKYNRNIMKRPNIGSDTFQGKSINVHDSINTIICAYPDDKVLIARDAGLNQYSINCKFNEWEIGKGTPKELSNIVEASRDEVKDVVILEIDSVHQTIKHLELPKGIVGIHIEPSNKIVDISHAVKMYDDWKSQYDE